MSGTFLRVQSVTKRFGGEGGIRNVTLDVADGERVVVVGRSGSGKTTLLRLIAGLERPDQGEIWLEGRQVAFGGRNLVSPAERCVGFVFQDLALWPHLTVRGNLDFVLSSEGTPRARRRERITEVLRLCRLDSSLANRYPHQLSGGEQQRLALARALAGSPRLLLLDEPFASLDTELRVALRTELVALQRQLRLTSIYVTHAADDAAAMAARVVTLDNGSIRD